MIIIDLVLVLVLGLEGLVLVLGLGLEGQVLVNITVDIDIYMHRCVVLRSVAEL